MAVRIALVGAGRIGRIHAQNLAFRLPEADFVTVTDVDRASAEQCAEDNRVPSVATNYQEVLERDDVDAVAICSSTDTHAGYIVEAGRFRLHTSGYRRSGCGDALHPRFPTRCDRPQCDPE